MTAIEEVLEKNAAEQREREEKERLKTEGKRREEHEQREELRFEAERQEGLMQEAEARQRAEAEGEEVERLRREKERLEGERLEQKRLEGEEREKKRLELEQREKERQEAEQQEKERQQTERLEAEASKLKQEERLKAEHQIRERERLEHESQPKQMLEKKARSGLRIFLELGPLRLIAKFSFVPFALVVFSWLLPFCVDPDKAALWLSGFGLLSYKGSNGLLGFCGLLCFALVFISSFLKYRWKNVLEAIVAWIGFIIAVSAVSSGDFWLPNNGVGYFLACTFAAVGAIMKTWLLTRGLKLKT